VFSAFAGVILINKPWHTPSDSEQYSRRDILVGSSFALSGAICGAFALLCMRIMRNNIHYSISPFWFASGCCFCSPIVHMVQLNSSWYDENNMLILNKETTVYDTKTILLITAASVSSFFGQIFASRAFQLEKAARISAINYLQIVVAFIWDIFYFKSNFEWTDILGCVLIIGVIFMFTLLKAIGVLEE
jgi:drug/metabolite transporter (DMT)-like permease